MGQVTHCNKCNHVLSVKLQDECMGWVINTDNGCWEKQTRVGKAEVRILCNLADDGILALVSRDVYNDGAQGKSLHLYDVTIEGHDKLDVEIKLMDWLAMAEDLLVQDVSQIFKYKP